MANFVAGSVAILVKPQLNGFTRDIKSQLASTGLASVGRDMGGDIANGMTSEVDKAGDEIKKSLPDDAGDAGEKAKKEIQDKLKDPLKKTKMSLGARFKKMGKNAGQQFKKNFGRILKGGLLLAGTALVAGGGIFLKDSIEAAGNLEQSMGGVDAVFGDAAESIHGFSKNAAQEMGLSQDAYNTLATSLGSTLKLGGLDGSALSDETQKLMGFSADLSSLYGGSAEEANTALTAALRGEFEPARKYGLQLSQNAIQEEAVRLGLTKSGEEMDANAKQQATLSLMYEQGAAAQGQFSKESDTLQGQQARTAASFENVKASVGEALLPAMSALFGFINEKIMPVFQDLATWLKDDLIPAFMDFGGWIQKNSEWLVPLGVAIGVVATAIGIIVGAMALWAGVTSLVTAANTALNLSFLASPIFWIILGIVALVAALVVAYRQSETFRNIVNGVWASIKSAIGFVIDWITGTVWPALQAAWTAIANAAIWLYQSAILPVWNGIKTAISAVADWVMYILVPWFQSAWTAISTAMLWLYQSIILPIWNAIKLAIAIVVTAVMVYIDLWKFYFTNVLAPIFTWLYNAVILPIWNAIKGAINAVVQWFINSALPVIQAFIAGVKYWFNVLKLGIQLIWRFIRNNIVQPVLNWFTGTVVPLFKAIVARIRQAWELFKLGLQIIWRFIRNNIIQPILNWFTGTVVPLFQAIITKIKFYFDNLKNNLRIIWNFIKNSIIAPVMNWFRNTLLPIFQNALSNLKTAFNNAKTNIQNAWTSIKNRLLGVYNSNIKPMIDKFKGAIQGLKSAFNKVKDGITTAWGKIRDAGKKPVKFVVQDIIRDGIVKKFNSVAETFGIDGIDEKKFTVGWAKGGILPGYHAMAKGDDVLTPMRSGEGVLVSEGLRDPRSRSAFLAANAAAKRGTSFADFMGSGYAEGGIVKLRNPFAGSYSRGDGFGARGGKHDGIDYPMPSGAILKAVGAGIVSHTSNSAAGNKLELSLGNGLVAGYHHLSGFIAKDGASVGRGSDIAKVGSTGHSSGPHLHFSMKKDGKYVDPAPYLAEGGEAGSSGGGFWNPFDGLWDSLKSKIREGVGDTMFGDMLFEVPKKVIGGALEFVKDKLSFWDGGDEPDGSGAERWRDMAKSALQREGQFSQSNLDSMVRRINQESGGDPNAINNWDSNAQKGTPSKGLLQTIDSTFQAYRDKALPNDVYDPWANMIASIRYAVATYGSVRGGYDLSGGYSQGGIVKPLLHDQGGYLQPGLSVIENRTRKPEYILNQRQWDAMYEGRTEQRGNVYLTQNIRDTNATANAIASSVNWEMTRRGIAGRR